MTEEGIEAFIGETLLFISNLKMTRTLSSCFFSGKQHVRIMGENESSNPMYESQKTLEIVNK
ncbi:hypothetical protein [Virgibacillus pantothenticus]|uniref:hypothetical protein n=1 Tax=Virgibacillus pantothenticus TaxID=1473 RepID=UPI0009846D26|nr:hypothetical protein [Virgibacillus pantothenticus]